METLKLSLEKICSAGVGSLRTLKNIVGKSHGNYFFEQMCIFLCHLFLHMGNRASLSLVRRGSSQSERSATYSNFSFFSGGMGGAAAREEKSEERLRFRFRAFSVHLRHDEDRLLPPPPQPI